MMKCHGVNSGSVWIAALLLLCALAVSNAQLYHGTRIPSVFDLPHAKDEPGKEYRYALMCAECGEPVAYMNDLVLTKPTKTNDPKDNKKFHVVPPTHEYRPTPRRGGEIEARHRAVEREGSLRRRRRRHQGGRPTKRTSRLHGHSHPHSSHDHNHNRNHPHSHPHDPHTHDQHTYSHTTASSGNHHGGRSDFLSYAHKLVNSQGSWFSIITVSKAYRMQVDGKKERSNTWFEGYVWQYTLCPICNAQLGWKFTRDNSVDAVKKHKLCQSKSRELDDARHSRRQKTPFEARGNGGRGVDSASSGTVEPSDPASAAAQAAIEQEKRRERQKKQEKTEEESSKQCENYQVDGPKSFYAMILDAVVFVEGVCFLSRFFFPTW